jgi:Zn-dependent protease with chaperone function
VSLWLRAAGGVLLLVAFPFLLFVFLAGLIVVALVLMFGIGLTWTMLLLVPAVVALIHGLRFLTQRIDATPASLSLVEHDHPELWALIRRLAHVVNARMPDDVRLTADANASVLEETRLLGLVSVRRRMLVGVPLMVGLDKAQLAAVLAHELAHSAKQHTRLARVAYRGRGALISTVSNLDADVFHRLLKMMLSSWTRLYLRASSRLSRRLEWAADEAAVRAAGSAATASALRETAALHASWQMFTKNHLTMGWPAGYLPADPFGGYAELRAALHKQLNEIRANPQAEASPYDSHPPLSARVSALDAMRIPPVIDGHEGQAIDLLNDPATTLDSALIRTLPPAAYIMPRVDWAAIAVIFGRTEALALAEPLLARAAELTGKAPTLGTLLAVLDSGRAAGLLDEPRRYRIGPGGQREMIRPAALRDGMAATLTTALFEVGAGRWELDWPHRARFVPTPHLDLGALIAAALANNPDTAPLRAVLATAGVDLNRTPNLESMKPVV